MNTDSLTIGCTLLIIAFITNGGLSVALFIMATISFFVHWSKSIAYDQWMQSMLEQSRENKER